MPASALVWLFLALVAAGAIPKNSQANVLWRARAWVIGIGVVFMLLAWHRANVGS